MFYLMFFYCLHKQALKNFLNSMMTRDNNTKNVINIFSVIIFNRHVCWKSMVHSCIFKIEKSWILCWMHNFGFWRILLENSPISSDIFFLMILLLNSINRTPLFFYPWFLKHIFFALYLFLFIYLFLSSTWNKIRSKGHCCRLHA